MTWYKRFFSKESNKKKKERGAAKGAVKGAVKRAAREKEMMFKILMRKCKKFFLITNYSLLL